MIALGPNAVIVEITAGRVHSQATIMKRKRLASYAQGGERLTSERRSCFVVRRYSVGFGRAMERARLSWEGQERHDVKELANK